MGAFRAQPVDTAEFVRKLGHRDDSWGRTKTSGGLVRFVGSPRWLFSMFLVVVTHHQSIATEKHLGKDTPNDVFTPLILTPPPGLSQQGFTP